jgi:hypothetical protein
MNSLFIICKVCDYKTKDNSNYNRHLKTKKHKKKVLREDEKILCRTYVVPKSYINKDLNNVICKYCKRKFSCSGSLARHINSCSSKMHIEKEYEDKISLLNKKLQLITKDKTYFNREMDHYKKEAEYYKYLFEEAGGIVKKSISSALYIQQNYVNAPIIKPLSIKDLKGLEQDKKKLINNILYTYRHDTIDRYIGDQIVATCLNEDPFKQYIWNTDSSRFTYMIRNVVNKVCLWKIDKGGRETAKYLIDPIMKEIKDLMLDHYKNECQIKDGDNAEKCIKLAQDSSTILSIIENINDKVINNKILKYITPPLTFRRNLIK